MAAHGAQIMRRTISDADMHVGQIMDRRLEAINRRHGTPARLYGRVICHIEHRDGIEQRHGTIVGAPKFAAMIDIELDGASWTGRFPPAHNIQYLDDAGQIIWTAPNLTEKT